MPKRGGSRCYMDCFQGARNTGLSRPMVILWDNVSEKLFRETKIQIWFVVFVLCCSVV